MKRITIFIVFSLSVINLFRFWFFNIERFSRRFNPEYFSKLYSQSQYVLGPKSVGGIGDDCLYAFAGYYYFFQGGDVSAVNFEHPPLGKYLIGLSIFLFNNENMINIIYFLLLLVLVYKTARLYLGKYQSLLPLTILMTDPLFLDHTIRSQLDLPFSLFFLAGVYFYILHFTNRKMIYLSQLFWSFAFATRFFPFLAVLEAFMLILVLYKNKRNVFSFISSLGLIPLVYLLSHFSFFIYHPSLIEFLRHKKWMLAWFTGTPIRTGNILRNIYTGWLFDSQGFLVKNKEWSPIQPVTVFLSILPLAKNPLYGFAALYFLYTVMATGGQAKFLMPIYPIMAILAVNNCQAVYCIICQWMRLKLQTSKAR